MKMISVIVPVYNAEKWIKETLDSLAAQTYPHVEIICVDDGSGDESCSIIENFGTEHKNVKLVRQKNAGVCAARNTGIAAAAGDYIAFVDADDYIDADMYEKMIARLEQDDSDIVFCEFVRFWGNGKVQYTVEKNFEKLVANPQDIRYFLQSTKSYAEGDVLHTEDLHGSVWRSVFKKALILENQIRFDTKLKFAEDQVFLLQYLQVCDCVSYIPDAMVHYRGHTKPWVYHDMYDNHMELLKQQLAILRENRCYSAHEKKQLAGYLKCSTYFSVINEELMFKPDAEKALRELNQQREFRKLLTVYNFIQKYKIRPEPKRIILFALLKLRMWKAVRRFYPNKKY
jgi:glycosyltransferase involved in cell wall biosynthesis